MGAACGSARDSILPVGANRQDKRNKDRKLTSLEDVINVKQRRNSDVKLTHEEKRKLYQRKYSVKKEDIKKIQQAK